ncbi:MAG: 2-amino-3,7-dideoxy-D-threo-hept-6-ulosonate synthase [Archaeoglobaceae archaeon]
MVGKRRRLKRLLRDGRCLIVALDHGLTAPQPGIEDIDRLLLMIDGYADAVVLHKGIVKRSEVIEEFEGALIIHLSGSTCLSPDPNDKRVVTSLESALRLGADAVSVHVNLSSESEARQIEELGRISDECDAYGLPLLAMVYPRGSASVSVETVKHAARVAYELGADIAKVPYVEDFGEVVRYCRIPVVIAGGSKEREEEFYAKVRKAIASGASGVAVGRNVFASENPRRVVEVLSGIVHGVEVVA